MASARISTVLQEELDISTKISNLESRASNLEMEFSQLLQTARQLVLATKRYVEKMEVENKVSSCWSRGYKTFYHARLS